MFHNKMEKNTNKDIRLHGVSYYFLRKNTGIKVHFNNNYMDKTWCRLLDFQEPMRGFI